MRVRGQCVALAAIALIGAGCGARKVAPSRPSPTVPTALAPLPATYIAQDFTEAYQLALVDTATGRILNQLTPAEAGGGSEGPTIPGERSVMYFGQGNGTCGDNIFKVPIAGGTPTLVLDVLVGGAQLDEASGTPSVRPDGQLLAVGRESLCLTSEASFVELAIVDTATGKQVVTDTAVDGPASTQAWSPDGTQLLAVRESGADVRGATGGHELHLLTLSPSGEVTGDRLLTPAGAGCGYYSAEFSPSTGDVLTDLDCGAATSVVELNPATGDQIATVLAAPPGESVGLGPIDPTGTYLMYQTSPSPPPTRLTAPVPVSWFVLANGRSTPLAVPPHATPEAW